MLSPTDQPCKTECVNFGYTVCLILIPPNSHFKKKSVNKEGGDLEANRYALKFFIKLYLSPKKCENMKKTYLLEGKKCKTRPSTASNYGENLTKSLIQHRGKV